MRKIILCVLIFLCFSLIGNAQTEDFYITGFYTGNQIYQRLSIEVSDKTTVQDGMQIMYTKGYVVGVFDALSGDVFNAPKRINVDQICDIAKKYLKEHPETRHMIAGSLLEIAFSEAFPLKDKPQETADPQVKRNKH